jgi:hypothetical protein
LFQRSQKINFPEARRSSVVFFYAHKSLADVAAHHRETSAFQGVGVLADLAVVLGHDDCHDPVAHYRVDGTAAARRIFDYSDPFVARLDPLVIISVIGGLILLVSAILLIVILVRSQVGEKRLSTPLHYALAVNPPKHVPASLNGFASSSCWVATMQNDLPSISGEQSAVALASPPIADRRQRQNRPCAHRPRSLGPAARLSRLRPATRSKARSSH